MRIELMAPEEFKRSNDFRVDVQNGVHARACTGGSIALAQSDKHTISGNLPDGVTFTVQIRVTQPHALVMLKLLALADRYNNPSRTERSAPRPGRSEPACLMHGRLRLGARGCALSRNPDRLDLVAHRSVPLRAQASHRRSKVDVPHPSLNGSQIDIRPKGASRERGAELVQVDFRN
jgi:hypothetical protein